MVIAVILILSAAVIRWEWRHDFGPALREAIARPRSMLDELESRPRHQVKLGNRH